MSSAKVRWAILGTSPISETMAHAIHSSTCSELVAIGSRSEVTGRAFADKFSIPKVYNDYQVLLDDQDIDAVYIGLPNHVHKEWAVRCANAGKHILCEKPFVLTAAEAEEAFAAVDAAQVICMEALMYAHHPFIKKIQELLRDNVIGKVKLIHAAYSADIAAVANDTAGGAIRNLGCYPVSLVRLLLNAEPHEMKAMGRMSETSDNDNQASVLMQFPDGVMAVVSTADDIKMHWQFDVFGTHGSMKVASNPWMPQQDKNIVMIYPADKGEPTKICITAEKPLYTYQIDVMSQKILGQSDEKLLPPAHSIGNAALLDSWLKKVKDKHAREMVTVT